MLNFKSELKFQLPQESVYFGTTVSVLGILIVDLLSTLEWSHVSSTIHGSLGFNY